MNFTEFCEKYELVCVYFCNLVFDEKFDCNSDFGKSLKKELNIELKINGEEFDFIKIIDEMHRFIQSEENIERIIRKKIGNKYNLISELLSKERDLLEEKMNNYVEEISKIILNKDIKYYELKDGY